MGHSFAGIALLMLMERFPQKIDLAVFVASVVLPSGVSLLQDQPLLPLVHTDYYIVQIDLLLYHDPLQFLFRQNCDTIKYRRYCDQS